MLNALNFDPVMILLTVPAILWGLSFHEFCHAFAAKMVGDPTAERYGRLTLNPLVHFDIMGTLLLLFAGFGWAKPVPINTRYFRNPRRDIFIVSIAGIAGNMLTAAVCVLIFRFFGNAIRESAGPNAITIISQMIGINLALASFNLIPIPPLDGSKLIYSFLPFGLLKYYYWLEQYGPLILLVLLVTGLISFIISPIRNTLLSILLLLLQ